MVRLDAIMDVDDPDPSERRQSQRVRVNEVVQFEVGGKRVVGLLTVINEGGFFVTTRYFLNPGVVTKFEIDLPEARPIPACLVRSGAGEQPCTTTGGCRSGWRCASCRWTS
ncbi:MAG: hypothetical protein U0610_08775 [bacterium]